MKKLTTLVLMAFAFCLSTFAQTITANDVDFGTVNIKGQTLPISGEMDVEVTFSNIAAHQNVNAYIDYDTENSEDTENYFSLKGANETGVVSSTYLQTTSGSFTITVCYSVKQVGEMNEKIRIYAYDQAWQNEIVKYINISINVVNEVPTTTIFSKVTSLDNLSNGDIITFVHEGTPTYVAKSNADKQTFFDRLEVNTGEDNTIFIPEDANTFTITKSGNHYKFVDAQGTLGLDDKAFYYTKGTTEWNIEFTDEGNAYITTDDNRTFITAYNEYSYQAYIQYSANNSRFKVYQDGTGDLISIYKKTGTASEVVSSVTFDPVDNIAMGTLELTETKTVEVKYTTENILGDDIEWDIAGTDRKAFEITGAQSNTVQNGVLYITYKGTKTDIGDVDAKLYGIYQDIKTEDLTEIYLPISLTLVSNTIRPNAISLNKTEATLYLGQTLQLNVTFDPENTEDKTVTWKSLNEDLATVDENGLVTPIEASNYQTAKIVVISNRDSKLTDTCVVTVSKPLPTAVTLTAKGQVIDDTYTMYIGSKDTIWGGTAPNLASQRVEFTNVNNNDIVQIKKDSKYINGEYKDYVLVTAKAEGTATDILTAKATADETVTKTISITVLPVVAEGIEFDPASIEVAMGTTAEIAAIFTPEDVTDQTLTYSGYDTDIISISGNTITALAEGETTITATTTNGKTATLDVTVTAQVFYTLVTNASTLQAGDKIVFANSTLNMIALEYNSDETNITAETTNVTFKNNQVTFDKALVVTLESATGGMLMNMGNNTYLAGNKNADNSLSTTKSKGIWTFEADGTNGVYAINTTAGSGNPLSYSSSSKVIRLYKSSNTQTLLYVYTLTPHEVETAADNISIEGIAYNGIEILNPEGKTLQIYNVNGMLLMQSAANINTTGFANGIYIVRCGNETMKIVK